MCFLVPHHEISFKMTAVLCSLLTTDDFSSLSPLPNAWRLLYGVAHNLIITSLIFHVFQFSLQVTVAVLLEGCLFFFPRSPYGIIWSQRCFCLPLLLPHPVSTPPLECLTIPVWRWAFTCRQSRKEPSWFVQDLKKETVFHCLLTNKRYLIFKCSLFSMH